MTTLVQQYIDCFGDADRLFWTDGCGLFESKDSSGGHVADFESAKQADLAAELLTRLCRRVRRKHDMPVGQFGYAVPIFRD